MTTKVDRSSLSEIQDCLENVILPALAEKKLLYGSSACRALLLAAELCKSEMEFLVAPGGVASYRTQWGREVREARPEEKAPSTKKTKPRKKLKPNEEPLPARVCLLYALLGGPAKSVDLIEKVNESRREKKHPALAEQTIRGTLSALQREGLAARKKRKYNNGRSVYIFTLTEKGMKHALPEEI